MSLLPDFFMATMDFNKEEFNNLQTLYPGFVLDQNQLSFLVSKKCTPVLVNLVARYRYIDHAFGRERLIL